MTDIEIARQYTLRPITEIADTLGFNGDDLQLYGRYKAKVKMESVRRVLESDRPSGKLILVSAITPTPAGEGKTTTSIGLTQGLARLGKKVAVALREPSLGPVFGIKGGATGGGYSQVLPMEEINLHFTGDLHAITAAHNLIAAALDNHLHFSNENQICVRNVLWNRVMDMNDRALRNVVVGLGGRTNGMPRECAFDITAASEVMAILCLSRSYSELKEKIGNILVATTRAGDPIRVRDLRVHGAAAALLKEALLPNLVQTGENVPAFIHGGPFANIAQGTNSIIATNLAIRSADYTVTEAGFGFDLGAEKFFDIVSPYGGFKPTAVVLVATVRALKLHGGKPKKSLNETDAGAVAKGGENLEKHIENIAKFGVPAIVAINRFPTDTDDEINAVREICRGKGVAWAESTHWADGGAGAENLAKTVLEIVDEIPEAGARKLYQWDTGIREKISTVAREIYGAQAVDYTAEAKRDLKTIAKLGYEKLPVCIAKTQSSLSDNPKLLGRPKDFLVTVRRIVIAAGAGFLVPLTGEILRMPGLPRVPSAEAIDIDDRGNITGLF
jgi:formate--tetrahydrofolate ligase